MLKLDSVLDCIVARVAYGLLFATGFAMSTPAAAQPGQQAKSDLHQVAQSLLAGRFPICDSRRYALQQLPKMLIFPFDKPDLIELSEFVLNENVAELDVNSVERMNGIEWTGTATLVYKASRTWDSGRNAWRDWRAGAATGDGGSYAFPYVSILKKQGLVSAKSADEFNRTFFPLACEQVKAIMSGKTPEGASQQNMGVTTSPPTTRPISIDPALALGSARVDPTGTTITTGGFAGLRVGHGAEDAKAYFSREMKTVPFCQHDSQTWTMLEPTGMPDIRLILNRGKIVAFHVRTSAFATRSGLRVGDPESRVKELFGRDPTLDRRPQRTENGNFLYDEYWLGGTSPTMIRIRIRDGRISDLMFGSTQSVGMAGQQC